MSKKFLIILLSILKLYQNNYIIVYYEIISKKLYDCLFRNYIKIIILLSILKLYQNNYIIAFLKLYQNIYIIVYFEMISLSHYIIVYFEIFK